MNQNSSTNAATHETVKREAFARAEALSKPREKLSLSREKIKLDVQDLRLSYGRDEALKGISLQIAEKRVTAFIGPSGCGKSTLLRCFNRMNDLVDTCRIQGKILMDGNDIYAPGVDVAELRRSVGMVFQ
jgi:phosphate transport system ATP-binding protein